MDLLELEDQDDYTIQKFLNMVKREVKKMTTLYTTLKIHEIWLCVTIFMIILTNVASFYFLREVKPKTLILLCLNSFL